MEKVFVSLRIVICFIFFPSMGVANVAMASDIVRCESLDFAMTSCGANIERAWVINQLSGAQCQDSANWWLHDGAIWVDDGCRADFGVEYATRRLVVQTSLRNAGVVTSSLPGISCVELRLESVGACTENYVVGTSVTLTATHFTGYVFMGWSGACSGTGGCTVTMDQDQEVIAYFAKWSLVPVLDLLLD